MIKNDTLIVGAGFAGSVVARELAEAGHRVHLIDKRPHIAGNAYDELDAHGVLVHCYGPHIFHTNGERIFQYLSRFTQWRPYEHRVRGVVGGQSYPFPINRDTLNQLSGLDLDEGDAAAFGQPIALRDRAADNVKEAQRLRRDRCAGTETVTAAGKAEMTLDVAEQQDV